MNRDAWNSHQWSSPKPRQVEIEPNKPLRQHHCSRCGRDFVESLSGERWAGDQATVIPPLELIAKMLTIKGHNIGVTRGDTARQKAVVDFVISGLEKGTLKPVIDRVFPFDQIVEAHRYLETSGQFGKIVVTI